jgi:hypothetical protein
MPTGSQRPTNVETHLLPERTATLAVSQAESRATRVDGAPQRMATLQRQARPGLRTARSTGVDVGHNDFPIRALDRD